MMTKLLQAVLALPPRGRQNTTPINRAVAIRPAPASSRWPAEQVAEWRDYRDRLLANINKAYTNDRRFPRWNGLQCEEYGPMGNDQRWLAVKIDMSSLHHTSIPMLINPDLLDWLSKDGVVGRRKGKRVEVIKNEQAVWYAIQLKPLPSIAAPQAVTLPELITLPDYDRPEGVLPSAIGVTSAHDGLQGCGPLVLDLVQPYHIIVGGLTQHGKTALVHDLLIGACRFASPAQLRVALVDPKGQFVNFDNLPHLFQARATDERAALKLVSNVVDEMNRRRTLFEEIGALDLDHYNAKAKTAGRATLPHMLLIVDEGVELSLTAGKAWMPLLTRIASRAASSGIRLVFIATSTTADVIDTTFRQLFGIRIAVKCSERLQSTKILGDGITAAAELPNVRGRFAANLPDRGVVVGQGYYLDRDELERQARALSAQWGAPSGEAPAIKAITLTDQQRDMIRWALNECDGFFKLREVSREFLGTLTAPKWLRDLAQEWEGQGLLHKPLAANASRRIGRELRVLVGWVEPADQQHTTHTTHAENA